MRERVCGIVEMLVGFGYTEDAFQDLVALIRTEVDLFKVMLNLMNLPQERFRRLLTARRFALGDYEKEWTISQIHRQIRQSDEFAEALARLFLEGKRSYVFVEHVADYYLEQLGFPDRWQEMLRDKDFAARLVRATLTGEYAVKKGRYIEQIVRDRLECALGPYELPWQKGKVDVMGKEIDIAIPNLSRPQVMIMIAYHETTSSNQTTRAKEQRVMFDRIQTYNDENRVNRAFVNVVDGGGWISRRTDLEKMYRDCHYCLNLNMLDDLDDIVKHHAANL